MVLIYGCFQKIGGTPPKWMVIILENPIKMDDLEGCFPLFSEAPICCTIFSGTTVLFRAEPRSFVLSGLVPNLSQQKTVGGNLSAPKQVMNFRVVATQIFFIFFPKVGEDYHFDSYFSKGLVQPPTRFFSVQFFRSKTRVLTFRREVFRYSEPTLEGKPKFKEGVKHQTWPSEWNVQFWPFEIDIYVMWNLW